MHFYRGIHLGRSQNVLLFNMWKSTSTGRRRRCRIPADHQVDVDYGLESGGSIAALPHRVGHVALRQHEIQTGAQLGSGDVAG